MPGKTCRGSFIGVNPRPGLARAHCEGRDSAAAGGLIGDNPHEVGSEGNAIWAVGFGSWTENPSLGYPHHVDCCATSFGGGYIP